MKELMSQQPLSSAERRSFLTLFHAGAAAIAALAAGRVAKAQAKPAAPDPFSMRFIRRTIGWIRSPASIAW